MKNKSYLLTIYLLLTLFLGALPTMGQRKMERMDRGVVAIPKNSSQTYVSWRYFATDPEDIEFNVYRQLRAGATETKLNTTPIKATNYLFTENYTASFSPIYTVKAVINGVESKEDTGSFTIPRNTASSRIVRDYDFEPVYNSAGKEVTMKMKFCWPADLDGDGRFDFVMDRIDTGVSDEDNAESDNTTTLAETSKVEAYTSEGIFLWRIDIGPNVIICTGHSDMVTAYDMNGDGKAEVLVAVSEGTTFADGKVVTAANGTVTDYSSKAGSAPQWISVIDGMTGCELDRMEVPFYNELLTTRTDSWKHICGHFVIAYLDGIKPSLIYQYKNRKADGVFQGAHAAYSFIDGKLYQEWANLIPSSGLDEFHQVRVGDVDGDGYDEFVEGGYVLDQDGSVLNRHAGVVHGDRHTLTDIDPDRPGQEHFFIQQNNRSTLGMGICDAETGELIKGIYQKAVGDVGRGICAAFAPSTRGLQFFSTMNSNAMYNCKGKLMDGATGTFPAEPMWWGKDLVRYQLSAIGNGGYNVAFTEYKESTKSMSRITPNLYSENNGNGDYYFKAYGAGRPAFWGDILGDWREELICVRRDYSGFVILSTWDVTTHRIYNLMQNPAYRGQTTARGYYQTADVDYYMAADMPLPPVPPVQKADLYYTGNAWIDNDGASASYSDGKSIMFDVRGGSSTYAMNSNMTPSRLWLMNPKGKNYTFEGSGKFTGEMDVVKSLQGDVIFNGNQDYTGVTRISEGRLFVNGTLSNSQVRLDARGVIGGNATLSAGIVVETGLNIEGGRLEPGMNGQLGSMTIVGDLYLPGRNNLAFDVDQNQAEKNDLLLIQGDLTTIGSHTIIIKPLTTIVSDTLTLVSITGTMNATADNFKVRGLEGIPHKLLIGEKTIRIAVSESRPSSSVVWSGTNGSLWDFESLNFLNGAEEDYFVPGDSVLFNNTAVSKAIVINETMPASALVFEGDSDYSITGDGAISGETSLVKTGAGKLSLLTEENSFTGRTEITGGTLEVSSLKDGGFSSSIGASSSDAGNWIMRNATLQTASQMATDRSMQVEGKLTVNNPSSDHSVLISGNIVGTGITLETRGAGTLTLQGDNNFEEVTIKEGLLFLGSIAGNSTAVGDGKIVMEGGTLQMTESNNSSYTGPFKNEINVPAGASARWNLPSRWKFENKLTGSGTIQVDIPYVRADFNGDWSAFTGTIRFTGDQVRLNNDKARNLANANVILEAGNLIVASNGGGALTSTSTIRLGSLSGMGTFAGNNNLIVGTSNTSTTYSGTFSDGKGTLTKQGTGCFTLSGANAYTGGTTVNGGILEVINTTGSATGTGSVTMESGTYLIGTGSMTGAVYIKSGANILPGSTKTAHIGTLKVGGNLVLYAGSKTSIKINSTSHDRIEVGGNLLMNGGTLEIVNSGKTFLNGDSFTIFNIAGRGQGSFTEITPANPGTGLYWDTSRIAEGVLAVSDQPTELRDVNPVTVAVYPTRVSNICHVSLNNLTDKAHIELINQIGVLVHTQDASAETSEIKIDMSRYSNGVYLVKIVSEGQTLVRRVIKVSK